MNFFLVSFYEIFLLESLVYWDGHAKLLLLFTECSSFYNKCHKMLKCLLPCHDDVVLATVATIAASSAWTEKQSSHTLTRLLWGRTHIRYMNIIRDKAVHSYKNCSHALPHLWKILKLYIDITDLHMFLELSK